MQVFLRVIRKRTGATEKIANNALVSAESVSIWLAMAITESTKIAQGHSSMERKSVQ